MKNFRSANHSPLNSIVTLVVGIFLLTACGVFSSGGGSGDKSGTGWKVWVKTSPCSGRQDWISVAKENPTHGTGGSFFQTADLIISSSPCTISNNCTFAQAEAAAATIRASDKFFNYCCREYSVWQDNQTGKFSVVLGKFSQPGNSNFVKGNLCCEEAEELAGITGACSGSGDPGAPPLGPQVRRTPGNTNTTTVGNTVGTNYNGGVVTATPIVNPTPPPYSTPAISNRWTLVSVTASPGTPAQGWSYNSQSSSARYDVYNGDSYSFQWTRPPQQIDASGFTISGNAQCQSKSRCSGLMNIGGRGIESDTPRGQWDLYANGENGAPGSGQKSITFKPSSSASELEVEIGLMWGAVRFVYKYQRAQ